MLSAGILGAGAMGCTHGHNLTGLPQIEVAAVCDIDFGRAENLSNSLGAVPYQDFDRMLGETEMDVLLINLPPYAQKGQFEKAAQRGIHIFIEKPIALNSAAGISMVEAARKAGIKTHVGFHLRHGTAVRKLRLMIDSGEAGRPVLFNGRYMCNALHAPWWKDANLCGGQIFEQALHLYDLCRYFFGHPKAVACFMGNVCHANVPGYTVEDVSTSSSIFPTGALAAITATNCAVPDRWETFADVTFENVTVRFENENEAVFHYISPEGVREERFNEPADPKFEEMAEFLQIIRDDRPCICPVDEGLRSLMYVEAAVFSAGMDGEKMTVKNY
jgi:predicted dehydrogenase